MVDRLRALLEEPLDPSVARAVLVLASAILLGFGGLFVLAADEGGEGSSPSAAPRPASHAPIPLFSLVEPVATDLHPPFHGQDPQDRKGSRAATRAGRALRSHRALQHVPYRSELLAVELAGARGQKAVLRITAATRLLARRGWRRFLRRYRDSGRAYIAIFRGKNGQRGG